jgi:predicted nucleic acid-binding protein
VLLTPDSSVLVAGLIQNEPAHADCLRLLAQIRVGQHVAVAPYSVLVEVVAAMRRRSGSEPVAARSYQTLRAIIGRFVELDNVRANAAQQIARRTALRGMDAIVVQVAAEFGSALVTLDNEIGRRAGTVVTIRTPAQI